ncbi:unnamed protein product [Hermetia illucens]|uniref:Bridge-like lipid transfer protein family member 1 C-terminal domain-containing protein n=1 Tax=Hermetia illucens TaxID=343691 RepID=A0A7R8URR0_HERIL|nr:transmembrane protein KIAA1109 isoform X4 [Hermetia illucens]CAD7085829.1 unnamed protein product [Hermetia illucens]
MEDYNTTQHEVSLEDLKMDAHMVWLLASLLSSICWVIYITFYNSRMVGLLLTKLINKWLIRNAYFKIGSLTLNPLAGKIMFRDVVYIDYDYSVRVQDGYMIFRWWRSYVPKDVSEDLSHSDTRLSITLNGFELHIYNRSQLYDRLEKLFGLKPSILIPTENLSTEELNVIQEQTMNEKNTRQNSTASKKKQRSEAMTATTWRDLIPVIKIDICSGRFVLGNRLTPTTLSITVEEAHCVYSTKPAACRLDHFMHFVKAKMENAKVLFAPSLKYTGLADEPPRYMGEGFVVMMSNLVELYFYMDEPGVVPDEPVQLTLANGDVIEPIPPVWGVDIKCGKGTDFSYGPWADRQRDHLFKFFFPPDWQEMTVTQAPKPGEYRQYQSFDISLCTLNEATIDILFSKEKETNAMHVTIGAGSYIEVTIPWVIQSDGFAAVIAGQLLHMEATTSLQYRSLAECESLEYKIKIHYPKRWNDNQDWSINLTGCKATTYIIYKHKSFFQDLIEDWSSKSRSDILTFVPYQCKFNILMKEFEIITLSNEYNWIDCSSTNQENHHLAFCGDLFDLSFVLPFDDFLPKTVTLKFWIHGEGVDLSMFLPEVSTSRSLVLALDKNARILTRSGKVKNRKELYSKKWRRICLQSTGWVDCWSVPIVALSIQYIYHPMPPLGPDPQADITTPEKEEILLSPMRIPKLRKSPVVNWANTDMQKFDPTHLAADHVTVELEIGSSILMAYGSILRQFIHLKENIFGEDQMFTDMEQSNAKAPSSTLFNVKDHLFGKDAGNKSSSEVSFADEKQKRFDPRAYRPLEVVVSVTLHDIQAHLMKNCGENKPACPVILIERLGFEMKKSFGETELQVLVSPSYLITADNIGRQSRDKHLKQGHLLLSAVQVRGHAMFSNEGRRLDEETLEYAWLLEIQLGKISGKLTMPQLCDVLIGLETFVFLTADPENCMKNPKTIQACHHGVPINQCPQTKDEIKYRCPSPEDIKYKMTRVSIDAIDLYLVESGTALHSWISPVRLATCNLHGQKVKSGVSGLLPTILFRLFVSNSGGSIGSSLSNTNTTGSSHSNRQKADRKEDNTKKTEHQPKAKKTSNILLKTETKEQQDEQTQTRDPKENYSEAKREREDMAGVQREKQRDSDLCEDWLEVACISLGPILLEGASALPMPDHKLHLVQHNFLRDHDQKSKRLWFLWAANGTDLSRCGCIGGCAFFGNNRNGSKFFKPSSQDIHDNYNIARYQILPGPREFGFGESILHDGQLVFHTPPYSLRPIFLYDSNELYDQFKIKRIIENSINMKEELLQTKEKGAGDKMENLHRSKESLGSPNTLERRSKRYSHTVPRQNSIEVPYSRLLDSPSKRTAKPESMEWNIVNSPLTMGRRGSEVRPTKSLKIWSPKTSISDSRLTGVEAVNDDISVPEEMSHSAPQSHPLEFEVSPVQCKVLDSEDDVIREVQRTISLTSENPSELFFSAEEDTANMMSQHINYAKGGVRGIDQKKRFSSDLSIGHHNDIGIVLSTHRSDLEIHVPESRHLTKRPQSTTELSEGAQRIHGLATPLRKINISSRPEFRHYKSLHDGNSAGSSSDSPSLSSASFISAMSSQEDMTLINLHMQVNRPIIDSPLLMASYLSHLAQIRCSNWNHCSFPFGADAFSIPLFQENDEGGLTYIGNKMVPHFDTYSNWKEIRIVPKPENSSSTTSSSFVGAPKSHPWDPTVLLKKSDNGKSTNGFEDGEFMSLQTEAATCTSFVVKLKGQVNVFLTPLMLEGAQRMVEALIPSLSNMHLLTAVHVMHSFCDSKVKNDNILKRDESLSYWSQVHSNSKRSTTERNLQGPGDSVLSDVYEESISTKTQGLIIVPKISVAFLQSSIVEEVISIAALDNIQDLSCVSLLAFHIEGVSTKFHLGKTTRASIHNVYIQQTVRSSGNHKKGGIMRGTKALLAHLSSQTRPDNVQGEPILIETSEKQLEELVVTLDIGKAHAQLRRLKNEGSSVQDSQTIITAIPAYKSQAMFECIRLPDASDSESMGSIMFECGLEGVGVKIIKRSHFEKSENTKDEIEITGESNILHNVNDMCSQASSNDGVVSKAESAWRLISKKPPTPKTPKEKFAHALEHIIIADREPANKDPKVKVPLKLNMGESDDADKAKLKRNTKFENQGANVKETDKVSSCVFDLKSVWFNFAAPPCVPITRKIDFTRLDWNLLSTASPAITAWMNPCNRFAIKIAAMLRAMHVRHTAIAACLMADALENDKIQRRLKTKKSRYPGSYTLLSKTLQEDPSCQLCIIMQLHVLEEGIDKIESVLKRGDLPHLNTLRQGVIVLSRQWKNTLYNPILFEHQYKNKLIRPLNVTFSFPQTDEEIDDADCDGEHDANPFSITVDSAEESENTLLLGQIHSKARENYFQAAGLEQPRIDKYHLPPVSPNLHGSRRNKTLTKGASYPSYTTSSRSSIQMLPIISGLVEKQNPEIEYGTLLEGSASSTNSVDKCGTPANQKEDLYFWMAKQQENKPKPPQEKDPLRATTQRMMGDPSRHVLQDSIRLLDAHLIFEPILTYLGVMPQQMINKFSNADISSLENFGTNLSLVGTFDSIRVDIVVSEAGDKSQKSKLKKPNEKSELNNEPSAFLCEKVGIELEVLKKTDKMVDEAKQNVIYISRRQLKKHTSTVVNFSLNIRFISQQVNMPLLRLLHQISNMYQNVKEAQSELKEQPDPSKKPSNSKDEGSIASETIDHFNSIGERFVSQHFFDEKYDKIAEVMPFSTSTKGKPSGSSVFPLLNPSPNAKNRPQSFAQKLRSTGKSVKGKLGYTNLNEASPLKESPTTTVQSNFKASLESKTSINGCNNSLYGDFGIPTKKNSYSQTGSIPVPPTPNCWKTIYHLLELYGTMPETKTIQRFSLPTEQNEVPKLPKKPTGKDDEEVSAPTPMLPQLKEPERTRLIVFGVAKIHKTRLLATLSGLKLEAEITTLNSSVTWRKKARPVALECSLTGQVGRTMIVLLEGVAPSQQTVVKITIGKSQTLYSSVTKRGKDKNSGLLSIGPVTIDIPQHPVVLHGMMTRSSKQLSSTLQELRVGRTAARTSRQSEEPDSPVNTRETQENHRQHPARPKVAHPSQQNGLLQPLVMQFNVLLQSLSINAALLPSLQAQYKMTQVSSTGITGSRAKFIIDLPTHSLSFTTKISNAEANLPPEASLALPQVHVCAEYIPENGREDVGADGIILRQGGYVSASAEIGAFERCLTTDLLNHLVFVQKVFMKEINEVLQKVYGGEKPVPLWMEDTENTSSLKTILFSIDICVKRIQLTATTPCSSAVRFETGTLDLHLSNRVKNIGEGTGRKLFGKAHIEFNLSLGQIIKNVIFDEAEPEFQQYAFFNTTVRLRNAFQDEVLNDDKELILLTLKRPLIYIQPVAVDKAILVWLNYKNAYEYWAEKRANISHDFSCGGPQMFDKVPFGQLGNIASSNLSALFLQLTVEDMGICLPLKQIAWGGARSYQDFEPKGAVVITLENTIISACNSGSLVSKGKFQGLCLRFADDFETTLDDWKPNMSDSGIMNLCVVSEGTYEVCSHTIAAKRRENAKWFLNVKWQMEGVDIHLDVNIGKQLSSLGHTLTMLTGFEEEETNNTESPNSDDGDQVYTQDQIKRKELENLPSFLFDPNIDSKARAIMMEKEMAEQLKIINDLRTLGASNNTITHEERRLQELQALCYKYFRRDMIQKWKRSSMRRGMLKTTNRSQSFVATSISRDVHNDILVRKLDSINSTDDVSSTASGPSRSASLRVCLPKTHRVTFSEAMRQTSLPNADVDIGLEDNVDDWLPHNGSTSTIVDMDDSQVELRRKNTSTNQKQQEPNIDFELNVKVLINSGKCVLHTKELHDEKIVFSSTTKHHKRERSIGNDWGSPTPSRKNRDKSKIRYNANHTVLVDLTIFHIPGLDVKLHYESTTLADDSGASTSTLTSQNSKTNLADMPTSLNKKMLNKRASLFTWIILQSIPEETIISPHILEFLEQTLEPIPRRSESNLLPSNPVNIELLPSNYATYASFPVDVIVYFHMQPSTFRFSCLPISRVECMLQLPSLDIVFSSKRSKDDVDNESDNKSNIGGLSVTGCLADFNLYIFHPYGGKKSGIKEAQFSPLTDSERKDSLSVNVEFVKFHLTRCRKLYIEPSKTKRLENQSKAVIRFSTIIDIGSASFKYDMRRLTEILAFPKAWYRKTIVRRLFLGDLSVNQCSQKESEVSQPAESVKDSTTQYNSNDAKKSSFCKESMKLDIAQETTLKTDKLKDMGKSSSTDSNMSATEQNQAWETLVLFAVNFTKLNVQMNMGNFMGNVVWLTRDFQSDGKLSIGSTGYRNMHVGIRLGGSSLDAKGGIVGGIFDLNDIDTQFHVKEESGKEPCHTIRLKLKALELRLDYMGTSILMGRISSFSAALRDEWKTTNDKFIASLRKNAIIFIHGDLIWDQLQIMISKSTTADILKIFYKLEEFFSQQFKSSKRVFSSLETRTSERNQSLKKKQQQRRKQTTSEGMSNTEYWNDDARHHRHWQKPLSQAMGLVVPTLVTKLPNHGNILGGTIELHGNNISLACFHGINFKSKSWALFSLREPFINFATEAQDVGSDNEVHIIETLAFSLGQNTQTPQTHSMAIVSRISRNIVFPPQYKTLTEWFHYAFANSEIDAVDRFPVLERDKEIATNSIERGRGSSVSGASVKSHNLNHNREVIFALPSLQFHFKTEHKQGASTPDLSGEKPVVVCSFITEFEDHIFVTVDADAFFFLHDLITSYVKEKEKVIGAQTARAVSPNSSDVQDTSSNKTHSTSSASNETTQSNTSNEVRSPSSSESHNTSGSNVDLEKFVRDWRHFECKAWHLEPTVRLLSWAGKSIEPYGIDYILNKLGFSHARITIPKWLQRGFMDPLDKVQALMMLQLLALVKENRNESPKI